MVGYKEVYDRILVVEERQGRILINQQDLDEKITDILTVVKSMVDLLVLNQQVPTIDYDHEKDIDLDEVEDLQEVHDETKPYPKYKVANKVCNKCGRNISWDLYEKDNPGPPLHVDISGHKIGDGSCPEYGGS